MLFRNIQFDLPKNISPSKPIYPKMKIFYLVTLFIIGTTANVVRRQSKGTLHFLLPNIWLKLVSFTCSEYFYKLWALFSGCECDFFISQNGWGNCDKFESDGRTMCYVKNPSTSTCPDKKASNTDVGKSWSYKACESATNTKQDTGGMSFQIMIKMFTS